MCTDQTPIVLYTYPTTVASLVLLVFMAVLVAMVATMYRWRSIRRAEQTFLAALAVAKDGEELR